eukprot:SAG31_NODE_118_length_24006_cov_8.219266_12_plen_100_part_00
MLSIDFWAGSRSALKFFAFGFDVAADFDSHGRLLSNVLESKLRDACIPSAINPDGSIERDVAEIAEALRKEGDVGPEHGESFEAFSATIRVCVFEKQNR